MRRILIIAFTLTIGFFVFHSPKPAFAAITDPASCALTIIRVNDIDYPQPSGPNPNPIPEFQDFYLVFDCVSRDIDNRNKVTATIKATVSGQQHQTYALEDRGTHVTATIGPYTGLLGTPVYAQYHIALQYASMDSGGLQSLSCNVGSYECIVFVEGDGVEPPPPPPGGDFCPVFKAFNPNPPVVNQSFQLQYNLPPNGSTSETYEFHWTQKDGTTGISPINKLTAPAYSIWVGTFTFNQETTIGLFMFGPPVGGPDIPCGSQTVFSGITVSPPPKGWSGKNPCVGGTCSTAIGYIPTNLGDFATAVLRIALGISGGIVLILMVIGSIRVMTSSGDPKNVAAGRDMIVAALTGALFIAFSVMIMQFLGTAVVPIPGLTFGT